MEPCFFFFHLMKLYCLIIGQTNKTNMNKEQISLPYIGKSMDDVISLLKINEGKFKMIQSVDIEDGALVFTLLVKPEEEQARLTRIKEERVAAAEEQRKKEELELQQEEEKKKRDEFLKELVKKEHAAIARANLAKASLKDPNTRIEDIDFKALDAKLSDNLVRTIKYLLYLPIFSIPGIQEHVFEELKDSISSETANSLISANHESGIRFVELPPTGYAAALCRKIISSANSMVEIKDWVAYTWDDQAKTKKIGIYVSLKSEKDITIGDLLEAYKFRVNYLIAKGDKTKEDWELTDERVFTINSFGSITGDESANLIQFLRKYEIIPEEKYIFLR